jgi:hypothetical protein
MHEAVRAPDTARVPDLLDAKYPQVGNELKGLTARRDGTATRKNVGPGRIWASGFPQLSTIGRAAPAGAKMSEKMQHWPRTKA